MMNVLDESRNRISTAQKLERQMGVTFFREVKDTITGELEAEVVQDIGMPGGSSPWYVASTAGLAIGSVYFVSRAAQQYTKSEVATQSERSHRKRRMVRNGLAGMACLLALLPIPINVTSAYPAGSLSSQNQGLFVQQGQQGQQGQEDQQGGSPQGQG
jgi:hypothetical protein